MPLPKHFYPKQSHIFRCDFSKGFISPEMVKIRPVVVVSPSNRHDYGLCTVVPISTTAPSIIKPWHVRLSKNYKPNEPDTTVTWAKCDMLYTVSFDRLDCYHTKSRQGRQYHQIPMDRIDFEAIEVAVKSYFAWVTD